MVGQRAPLSSGSWEEGSSRACVLTYELAITSQHHASPLRCVLESRHYHSSSPGTAFWSIPGLARIPTLGRYFFLPSLTATTPPRRQRFLLHHHTNHFTTT